MISEETIYEIMNKLFTKKEIDEYGEQRCFENLEECVYSFDSACDYYIDDHPEVLSFDEFVDWDGLIQDYNFGLVIDDECDENKVYVDNVLMEEYFGMEI